MEISLLQKELTYYQIYNITLYLLCILMILQYYMKCMLMLDTFLICEEERLAMRIFQMGAKIETA